jgi:predicted acyl esterase
VYPADYPDPPPTGAAGAAAAGGYSRMGGYQQMVRGEVFRGKFRNSFEKPEPFQPNTMAKIEYVMPDVFHTFRRGHRIMIQVQSSWFPLVNLNPQKFVTIPQATEADFQKATERIYRGGKNGSRVDLNVIR